MAFRLATWPALDDRHPVGASKLGGRPDLPPDMPWPLREERYPLSFVMQVDLATADTGGVLPADGLLSFFYDAEDEPWGFEDGDETGSLLLYVPAGTPLARRDFPDDLDEEYRFGVMSLAPEPADDVERHRLLGEPDLVQSEPDPSVRLVLQVGSDDDVEMMWGDGGYLYVYLTPAALARRDWASARVVLECH